MVGKRKTLGRGLDALLSPSSRDKREAADSGELRHLPIDLLQRGKYQPRHDMRPESLQDLADSIKAQGVVQPIVVRPIKSAPGQPKRYEIIAGERRWRAAQQAGLDNVPVIIRDVSDEAAIAMALIENIQREDLNAMEEAFALQRLQNEFELTQQQVADAVGKSRSAIANLLRLLQLSEAVRLMLERGDLEMGHARCLLPLDEAQQLQLAREVVAKGLSVRQTEELVRKAQQIPKPTEAKADDADINHLQNRLSNAIGAAVTIKQSAKGKGKMTISYATLDQLDGIIARLEP